MATAIETNARAEIRDYGDNKMIVVFTTDNQIAQNMKNRNKLIKEVDYCKHTDRGVRCVGKDFYFPKRELRSILRGMGFPKPRGFTLGRFHQIKI